MVKFLAIAGALSALIFVSSYSPDARADRVARTFKGQIVITKKRAPSRFRSQGAMIRWLRGHRKKHIWPEKTNDKMWKFEFMAFLKRPLNDLEVTVKFYDITEGKKFIAADTFYTRSKTESILAFPMTVEKPRFAVNRKYQMLVLSARNTVLASTKFWLRGQKETYSGRVTFTDEEARIKD
jgi:hypothetical protein